MERANALYRAGLDRGEYEITATFDLATHNGFCSIDARADGEVGRGGVAIDSIEDMKRLFDGIPLDQVSISMSAHGAVIPNLACLIVAGEEQGLDASQLNIKLLSDIQHAPRERRLTIFPAAPTLRSIRDILIYANRWLPRFQGITVADQRRYLVGATDAQEIAYVLAEGREYLRSAVSRRQDASDIAKFLQFAFASPINGASDVVKLRAARLVWKRIMSTFGGEEADRLLFSARLKSKSVNGATELAAVSQPANAPQLQEQAAVLADTIRQELRAIDKLGGIATAIDHYQSMSQSADTHSEPPDAELPVTDEANVALLDAQKDRLRHLQLRRDPQEVRSNLSMVEACANVDRGNLLELAIEAVRARASLGEITGAMERSFGRCVIDADSTRPDRCGAQARFDGLANDTSHEGDARPTAPNSKQKALLDAEMGTK